MHIIDYCAMSVLMIMNEHAEHAWPHSMVFKQQAVFKLSLMQYYTAGMWKLAATLMLLGSCLYHWMIWMTLLVSNILWKILSSSQRSNFFWIIELVFEIIEGARHHVFHQFYLHNCRQHPVSCFLCIETQNILLSSYGFWMDKIGQLFFELF